MSRPKLKHNRNFSFHCDPALVARIDGVSRSWKISRNQLIVNLLTLGVEEAEFVKPLGILRRSLEKRFQAAEASELKPA